MKHLRRYLPLLALLLMLAGSITSCRDAGVRDALQRAEALMESDPHATRAMLMEIEDGRLKIEDYPTAEGNKTDRDTTNQLPVDSQRKGKKANFQFSIFNFQSKRDAALYALLRTQADYKCRVRLTSDSLIRVATNYYGTKRKTQRAALAQYYLGCTYSDMHRDLDAIDALLRATTLFPDTTNKYYAYSLFELGKEYLKNHMNDNALETFELYRSLYACTSDSVNLGYVDYYMGLAAAYNGEDNKADSLFHCVIRNHTFPIDHRIYTYFELAKLYFNHLDDVDKALEYIDNYCNYFYNEKDNGATFALKANILLAKDEPIPAYENYQKALKNSSDIYTLCTTYKGLTQVSSLIGKTDSTSFFVNQYTTLLDSIYSINRQQEIAEIQNNHVIELHDQQLKSRHTRFLLLGGLFFVVAFSAFAITLLLNDRKRKKHNLQLQEELRQANVALLQAQNEEQLADMDALYRNKLAACQNLFRSTPSARLLLTAPEKLTSEQRQALMDDLTRSFVDIMVDIRNASNGINNQEMMYCILSSLQCSTTQMAVLLNTTDGTLRKRKLRLKEKMPENLISLFFS